MRQACNNLGDKLIIGNNGYGSNAASVLSTLKVLKLKTIDTPNLSVRIFFLLQERWIIKSPLQPFYFTGSSETPVQFRDNFCAHVLSHEISC